MTTVRRLMLMVLTALIALSFTANAKAAPAITPVDGGGIRFVNVVPDTAGIDIYADGRLLVSDLRYGFYSKQQFRMPEGSSTIEVALTGSTDTTLVTLNLKSTRDYRGAIYLSGSLDSIDVTLLGSSRSTDKKGAKIRFAHFAVDSEAVDIKITGKKNLTAEELTYQGSTSYRTVTEGRYTISVYTAGTDELLASRTVNLRKKDISTIFVAPSGDGLGIGLLTDK